jgi:hypothetical protein
VMGKQVRQQSASEEEQRTDVVMPFFEWLAAQGIERHMEGLAYTAHLSEVQEGCRLVPSPVGSLPDFWVSALVLERLRDLACEAGFVEAATCFEEDRVEALGRIQQVVQAIGLVL